MGISRDRLAGIERGEVDPWISELYALSCCVKLPMTAIIPPEKTLKKRIRASRS